MTTDTTKPEDDPKRIKAASELERLIYTCATGGSVTLSEKDRIVAAAGVSEEELGSLIAKARERIKSIGMATSGRPIVHS